MTGSEDRRKAKGRLIPEGELPCIWMDAGLIAYKLCNYEYECESCPFDAEMKMSRPSEKDTPRERRLQQLGVEPGGGREHLAGGPLTISEDCYYHPGHAWARLRPMRDDGGRLVHVGVDQFAATVLPRVKDAILPQRGGTVRQGHVFCWIVCSSSTLPILAPISGTVVAANPKIGLRPKLINIDPYGEGWLVSVDPSDLERELASLLRGKSAASWIANEQKKFERLTSLLRWPTYPARATRSRPEVGVTLADGGERFLRLADSASVRRYFEFITQFFL